MASFDFDRKFEYIADGASVKYGVKYGDGRIVFIKVGLGGDIPGYEKKYLRIAERLNKKYGCSVICASNPEGIKDQTELDRRAIADVARELRSDLSDLCFFGHSNGGVKGLILTASGITFRRMLLVNMPLMINMFKTKKMISDIPDTYINLVYGEKDPSVPYIPFFDGRFDNLDVKVVEGADHNFFGMLDEFVALAEMLFDKEC
jgi:hypothetical protein